MNPIGQQMPPEEEEEDTDYDIFASVRPVGITVDDNPQDEADGEEVDNFSQFRPREDEIREAKKAKKKPAKELSYWETAKDVGKQALKETLIGAGGTWGDLAELAGINRKGASSYSLNSEVDTLERLKKPGYKPSFSEIYDLSDDDGPVPSSFNLPTSKELRSLNEAIGGPGEPETRVGRYAARAGKIYGSGLAVGQVNPVPALAAGAAGEGIEEAGGGPLLQAAGEIASLLLTQGRGSGKNLVSSTRKEVGDKINKLRDLGYSEQDITLAINSASQGKKFGVKASKGPETERAFERFAEKSDDLVKDILESQVPGFEKGPKYIRDLSYEAYGKVADDAANLNIKNLDPFFDSLTPAIRDIRKSMGHGKEAKEFITELTDHTMDIISNPTADNMIDFYKRLNSLGKWVRPSTKDHIIGNVKNAIKDTFRAQGPKGKALADDFERVNAGVQKAYKASEVTNIIDKAKTQDGINYKNLSKAFDKKSNVDLFEDVLGSRQAENLQMIAKTGKQIKDFDKSYKATSLFTGTPTSMAGQLGYLIYSGNWPGVAAIKGTEAVARKLAEKSLTDPKFQNLLIRGLHAIKNESPKAFRSVDDAMKKYVEEQRQD